MKTETIHAFLEALKDNPAAEEIIRNTSEPQTEEERIRVYAKIASELGFDLTEQDLTEYVEKRRQTCSEQTQAAAEQIRELPPEELADAAGGGENQDCKDSFKDRENCWVKDGCDIIFHKYESYDCHWDLMCHHFHADCDHLQQVHIL